MYFIYLDLLIHHSIFQIIFKLTNDYQYSVVTGLDKAYKFQRIITENGICDTFNSKIAAYMSPEFYVSNELPKMNEIYEVNFFDFKKFSEISNLRSSSEVSVQLKLKILKLI